MMKLIAVAALLIASALAPARALAACTQKTTGLNLCIPSFNDDGDVWGQDMNNAFAKANDGAVANSSTSVGMVGRLAVSTLTATPGSTSIYVASPTVIGSTLDMNSHQISNVSDPSTAQQAATKNYVDSNISGLQWKASARYATTAALPSNVYNNGTSGVGATLTGVGIGLLAIDGVNVSAGDRVLINNEATAANNGIYTVTTNTSLVVYVLTRVTDHDAPSEMGSGTAVFVDSGTANADSGWVQIASVTTVGTTPLNFAQFTGLGEVTAGSYLTKSGNTISLSATGIASASGTFTATGAAQYSIATSSGISMGGGGLKFPDGTIQYSKAGAGSGDVTASGNNAFVGNNTHAGSETQLDNSTFTVSPKAVSSIGLVFVSSMDFTSATATPSLSIPSGVQVSSCDITIDFDLGPTSFQSYVSASFNNKSASAKFTKDTTGIFGGAGYGAATSNPGFTTGLTGSSFVIAGGGIKGKIELSTIVGSSVIYSGATTYRGEISACSGSFCPGAGGFQYNDTTPLSSVQFNNSQTQDGVAPDAAHTFSMGHIEIWRKGQCHK